MPIQPETVPAQVNDLAARSVTAPLAAFGGTQVAGSASHIAAPHKVYILGVDQIAGKDLGKAVQVSWRFLILNQSSVSGAVEISTVGPSAPTFSHLNYGPFVSATSQALEVAESIEKVQKGFYNLRLLKIPGLYVMALWMHAPTDDMLIPMSPCPKSLIPYRTYAPAELFEALEPIASTVSKSDNSPKGEPPS